MPIGYNDVRPRDGSKGFHYAMTHNWDIIVNTASLPKPLNTLSRAFGDKESFINISCLQVTNLPNSNMNEGILSGNVRGIPFHQPAGRESSVREINLSMNEFWDYRIFRFFETWKSMAVNRFDFSQNLDAMLPSGVSIVWTDSDRQNVKLTYNLYDIVCTKCNLAGELTSEPDFMKTTVSLKFGNYTIGSGDRIGDALNESDHNFETL
jgi:hypothetical protein